MTGVGYTPDSTGVAVSERGNMRCYRHRRLARTGHGTGDVYAAAFTGAYLSGRAVYDAAVIAADFTLACVENTLSDPGHWYGVKFEPLLAALAEKVKGGQDR